MNEIEKLYKKAGIKPTCNWWCGRFNETSIADCNGIYDSEKECSKCKHGYVKSKEYPPFTAEKQLDLTIFIINKFGTLIFYDYVEFTREVMANKIAKFLNSRWQDLSDILKQQIKEILE